MSETSNGTGGGSIGGDSDSSFTESTKVCRDFMRNVCQRPNCRFLHPENIKVRTDPIFCHDFQQGKCYRVTCKFIHCTKEDEDHYRKTGELPEGVSDPEEKVRRNGSSNSVGGGGSNNNYNNVNGGTSRGSRSNKIPARAERNVVENELPICKDFLKGMCDRGPRGCKYRHVLPRGPSPQNTSPTYGPPVMVRGRGGVRMMMAPVVAPRRKGIRSSSELYDEGPEPKRFHQMNEYYEEEEVEEELYELELDPMIPPPPPPRGMLASHNQGGGYYHHRHQLPQHQGYVAMSPTNVIPQTRNGVTASAQHHHHLPHNHHHNNNNSNNNNHNSNGHEQHPYFQTPFAAVQADTIKSLEDENFMLKRRIEELKSSNEFLLSQNAQLRLSNTLSVGTSVAQVQPLSVSAVSVSAAGPSAQPSIIGITSSSLSGTQPLPTISISTLPTVTPVSISQTQIQTQTQPPIYLTTAPN